MKREVKALLESVIKKYFIEGKPDKIRTEGVEEIKRLLKRYDVPYGKIKSEINPLIKEIQDDLGKLFLDKKLRPIDGTIQRELLRVAKNGQFGKNERQKKIYGIIEDVLSGNPEDINTALVKGLRKIKLEERYIEAEKENMKLALNNIKRAQNFISGDVKYLCYVGPETERSFCKEHLDKVYTLEEVQKMVNDFGQPALIYNGGYGPCRHRWINVIDNEVAKKEIATRLTKKL